MIQGAPRQIDYSTQSAAKTFSPARLQASNTSSRECRGVVLFVLNDAAFFVSHRLPLAIGAMEAGYEVHLACPHSPVLTGLRAIPLTVHDIPVDRRGANPVRELGTLLSLIRLYRRVRPALVHHVTVKPVLYGSLAARLARVPAVVNAVSGLGYVFISKGWVARLRRSAVEFVYRRAFAHPHMCAIFQNPDDRERFCRMGIARPESTVLIRGSGVDLASFVPQPEARGVPVVTLAARMLWDKGVGEFVGAAEHLKQAGANARFVLVGDTDSGNPSAVPAEQLNAWVETGIVEWWGKREDMPAVLAMSSIVCLPSYREGLPKVLLEAAAAGRPIVTTDVPGCREAVRDGDNGYLVPARNVDALAGAIARLLEDADARARMGVRSREIAESEFGIEQVVEATLAVYDRLLR